MDTCSMIDFEFPEHLRLIREFLCIRSTADHPAGLGEAANWVKERIARIGGIVSLEGKQDAPIVYGRLDIGAPKTLLVYGMYDVQPVSGQEHQWISDPFGAEIRTLPGEHGECVVARGACNSKGPLAGFLNALDVLHATDGIPCNLIFTVEGEEESGSPTLPSFYKSRRDELRANAAFEPFWADYGTDVQGPSIALGCKGVCLIRITCAGGDWGGPIRHEVHSSVAPLIGSPVWRLTHALASLIDEHDNLRVSGLDPGTVGPTAEDERLLQALARVYDQQRALRILGAKRFKHDLPTPDLLRHYLYSTTANPYDIDCGTGDTIPNIATAHLVVRLAPGITPEFAMRRIRGHLDAQGYSDVRIECEAGYPGSRTSIGSSVVQSLLQAYRDFGVQPHVWPLMASATPSYLFTDLLGLPFVHGGLGRAGGSHSENEYAEVEGLRLFEKSLAIFLRHFADS